MNAQEIDSFFFNEVGPVWSELRGGLWHTTGSHRFREILETGEIQPAPNLAPCEFRWASGGTTYSRSIGAVSLFDFAEADWAWLLDVSIAKAMPRNCWGQFLGAPVNWEGTPENKWVSTVWIAVDRCLLPNFMHWRDADKDWKAGDVARKWMPRIEACHIGPLPDSAYTHIVVVCAVEPREFRRMTLHPFDWAELDQLETEWRNRFAVRYANRALSQTEREQGWIKGLKKP